MKKLVKKIKRLKKTKVKLIERNPMTLLEFATSLVTAITADVAAGNTNFAVSAKPDNTAIVLSSSVVSPASKTEEFPVADPNAAV